MKFDNEDKAWEYWREEIYYGSGEGYVGLGRNFDAQVDLFQEWVEEEEVVIGCIQNLQD